VKSPEAAKNTDTIDRRPQRKAQCTFGC